MFDVPEQNQPGREQPGREQIVARLRPHVRALFWPTVLLVTVAGAYGFLGSVFAEQWLNIGVGAVAAAIALVGWLVPLLSWLARNYTITTRRIVLRSGIFVRLRQEVLHSRVSALTVRTGGLQSVFGSGDILIDVGSAAPLVLKDVPSAILTQDALHDLMESNRRG
ncbi:MAG: PH domain-containing protein [Rhodoglobus sp.]|nr:PH domain-containing protein [Rhodoglobus sp.]